MNSTARAKPAVDYLKDFAPRALEEGGVTGASIVLLEQGEPVWTYVYGTANRETAEPVTPQTRFNVGSVSKVAAEWGDDGGMCRVRTERAATKRWRGS